MMKGNEMPMRSLMDVYMESKRFEREMSKPPVWFSVMVLSVMAVGFGTIFMGLFNLAVWMVR